MNLISCLGKGYVITYVCKGGTLPNIQKQQQQNEQSFRIYFQHGWHKTRSALPKKDQASWHLRQGLLLLSNKCKQNVLTSMKLL